jgi:hypothetical protein
MQKIPVRWAPDRAGSFAAILQITDVDNANGVNWLDDGTINGSRIDLDGIKVATCC